ncbi:arylsulfatase [Novosphingobium resinovorum]|uniref:Arylsulfatase n=1 Tax=Novosphingobium resinovorum TaxID=158500 RepID=A0A1D8ACN5_9SPHN|nr:arylsulfatase [Novosphingobium resinovorum]AOR79872.1 arylsulfatase [Novosphingobium resinovorum]
MPLRLKRLLALSALTAVHANAEPVRTILPVPPVPFNGTISESVLDSTPTPAEPVLAPDNAPNVLVFMSDDTGFAMSSAFGGPVPTPNIDRLAAQGQRYNRFHTTGICSPSRAALLTGRNHHNAGNGYLSEMSAGFPGYAGTISRETATIAQVLRLNGYSTAMFGKHHNTTSPEKSAAGPFDNWPTGLGFEYFYGFMGGDTDQFDPVIYRGTDMVEPDEGNGRMVDRRLADDMINWVHNQKAAAPDKPFFVYYAPGSMHAPHQAPTEYIARFKGRFDKGWDVVRQETFRRQLAEGIIPRGTRLTPRPEGIPAWDSLTPDKKAFAARTMEVAAAQLVYQDEQIGRVLDELQRMGELKNTLVTLMQGDNGASGEAGPDGTINELRSMGRHDEDEMWVLANTDKLGGPMTYQSYPVGWAWAMSSPLRWTKQFASMLGGIRNDMIMSWPGHVQHPGSVCAEFGHLVDIAPTVLDAASLPAPEVVLGARQKPMDGRTLLPSLASCEANRPRTQYFEIGGKIGLYHDGWFLSGEDGRPSWENLPPTGERPKMDWTLYDLSKDFSQSTDLSTKEPQRMAEMMALWKQEATRNNVFPLDHRFATGRAIRGTVGPAGKHFDYWGKNISMPALGGSPCLAARSFTINADLVLDRPAASGAIVAWGSRFGGWSLYLDQGHPVFVFARSTDPKEITDVRASAKLPQGKVSLRLRFAAQAPGKGAEVVLSSGGQELPRAQVPVNVLMPSGTGEMFDIGRDLGVPVTDYRTPHGAIEGDVPHVTIDLD